MLYNQAPFYYSLANKFALFQPISDKVSYFSDFLIPSSFNNIYASTGGTLISESVHKRVINILGDNREGLKKSTLALIVVSIFMETSRFPLGFVKSYHTL